MVPNGNRGLREDRRLAVRRVKRQPQPWRRFLVLGIVYLLTTQHKWLAVPLFVVLPMAGSRWALIVCAAVVIGMVGTKVVPWKTALGMVVVLVGVVSLLWPLQLWSGVAVSSLDSLGSTLIDPFKNGAVTGRLAVPHIPSFLPTGIAEHPGLHTVPVRIAVENGILAAVAWVGVTVFALFPRHHGNNGGDSSRPVVIDTSPASKTAVRGLGAHFIRFDACWWFALSDEQRLIAAMVAFGRLREADGG